MASTGTTIQKEIDRLKKAKSDIKASIIAKVTSSPKTLTLGTTNLEKLNRFEKSIATNKGWVLK